MGALRNQGEPLDQGEWAENVDWTRRLAANVRERVDRTAHGAIRDVLRHRLDHVDQLLAIPCPDVAAAKPLLRSALSVAAGAAMAECFQSPPVGMGAGWDYHRDRHRLGETFEREWLDEMVPPAGRARPLRALLTGSGMAAVSTVLALLEREAGPGPIVVDAASYHETRHLLATGALGRRLVVVPSHQIVDAIRTLRPSAVVTDAVANRPDTGVADLAGVIGAATPTCLIVVDVSLCSTADPWIESIVAGCPKRLVLIESLTKHAQFGLDRVSAGMIVAGAVDADRLDTLREHLGTNISDLVCAAIPPPDRDLLRRRLARTARNAARIAERMADAGIDVSHASLAGHRDHRRWQTDRPTCPIVGLAPADPDGCVRRALRNPIGVDIDHGVGFGFDTTRIFRTTRHVPEASVFVRVAAGTEPVHVATAVADVLAAAARHDETRTPTVAVRR